MAHTKLREIVYLDRQRVESYISQLTGALTVQQLESTTETSKAAGSAGFDVKVMKLDGSKGHELASLHTTTAVPAHAILSRLESLLAEHELVANASSDGILPGQIAHIRGDATFESWGLLASLADSVQGVAKMGIKLSGMNQSDLKTQHEALAKRARKGQHGVEGELNKLGMTLRLIQAVDAESVSDVKNLAKLFFQDQNHVRITSHGKTFVGLLRKENLVGSTMEEMLFDYGAKPRLSFDALFYVSEFGREEATQMAEEFTARFARLSGRAPSLGLIQDGIRELGSLLLDVAEEIRRPIGPGAAFVVPLALYREIRGLSRHSQLVGKTE